MFKKLSILSVPFPSLLMSTSRTPMVMSPSFAREIRNIYSSANGAGAKRNGVIKIGTSLSNEKIIRLFPYIADDGDSQILAATDLGNIYLKTISGWIVKKSGLSSDCIFRWVHFAGKLIVCNGIDPTMSWDGVNFFDIAEWVKDLSTELTYISTTHFSIEGSEDFYPVGRAVQCDLGVDGIVESTVASTSVSAGVVTITIDDAVLTANLDTVSVEMKPPAFAYFYAAHDRLWGVGKDVPASASFSSNSERAFIYYTNGVGDETAWHTDSGALPYINLADKMPVDDELVAMAVKDGMTVFFFRNNIQLWSGYDPTSSGDMAWMKTIPLGAVHADLVMEMPNDVGFFTSHGVRTLSRVLQTEQLEVGDLGSEIDPSIAYAISELTANDEAYRKAAAFRYDKQGWFGFRPTNEMFVFQITGSSRGWTLFDGIFKDATAFLNSPDGNLYVAKEGQLYQYDETVYADDTDDIRVLWWTPWLSASNSGGGWANKYIEVLSDQGAAVTMSAKRYKSYNSSSSKVSSVDLMKAADYWGEGDWDVSLFDNGYPKPQLIRDHYIADVFSYAFENSSSKGPLILNGFKLYGVKEK